MKRFISFLAIMVILPILIFFLISHNRAYSSVYEEGYVEVRVKRGDTLWKIALDNMPLEYDVRKMVYEIMKFNDMDSADIYPGDLIKIPIRYNCK